jgi:hypothetical protein
MHEQHGSRRFFMATLVMVALALVGSDSASAASHKRPDFGSAEGFRLECELLGGTFSADGLGNTNCHYPDGTWIQCDANGNDCWITPSRTRPPAETLDPDDISVGEATTDVDGTSVVGPDSAGHALDAADRDKKPAKNRHGKGKKRKK